MTISLVRRSRLGVVALVTAAALSLTSCTGGFFNDPGEVNSVDESVSSSIDEAVTQALELSGSTNAIVGVWSSSGEFVRSYGDGVSVGSAIRAAQASQPVMCALLLELVENGTVKLDDEVSNALPRQVGIEGITYRMLCDASSGLANFTPYLSTIFANNPTRPWSDRELLAHSLARSPLSAPGAQQHVSDANAVLLGRALAAESGQRLDDLLEQHVFSAAGMGSTYYPGDPLIDVSLPAGGMTGFTYQFANGEPVCVVSTPVEGGAEGEVTETAATPTEVTKVSPSMLQGAGATVTTVNDLKGFLETYVAGGFGPSDNASIVTSAWQGETPLADEEAAMPASWTFGLEQVGNLFGLSGSMTGTITAAYHDPTSGFSVVISLNNSTAGAAFARALAVQIAGLAGADVGINPDDAAQQLSDLAVCLQAEEATEENADQAEDWAAEE